MKKIILIISCVLLANYCFAQRPKRAQVKKLVLKTLDIIKAADTNAYIKLWKPFKNELVCGYNYNIDSITEDHDQRQYFKKICINWTPYLNDLEVGHIKRHKSYIIDKDGFLVEIYFKSKSKKNFYIGMAIDVAFYNNELLYSLSLPPSEICFKLQNAP